MRLRHIVPTLGLIAAAGTAQAVETAPGLSIGGFVDTTLDIVSNEGMPAKGTDLDTLIDFNAMAELQVGYAVSEVVQLQVDVELYAEEQDFDGDDVADDGVIQLEQAYVAYGVSDKVTLMMGKWEGLIGYEAWDAPDLYRVNTSPVFDLNGVRPIGLDVNVKGTEEFSADFYIANGVLIDDQVGRTALGLGASLTYATETYLVDLDIAYDMEVDAAENSLIGINLSGEYSGMENLVAFGDFAYRSYDAGDVMGIMVGANYAFNPKASATLMFSYIADDDENEIIDEEMEIALAVLTMPTGDENFAVNFEIEYTAPEADGFDSEVGFYVELLGIIP